MNFSFMEIRRKSQRLKHENWIYNWDLYTVLAVYLLMVTESLMRTLLVVQLPQSGRPIR